MITCWLLRLNSEAAHEMVRRHPSELNGYRCAASADTRPPGELVRIWLIAGQSTLIIIALTRSRALPDGASSDDTQRFDTFRWPCAKGWPGDAILIASASIFFRRQHLRPQFLGIAAAISVPMLLIQPICSLRGDHYAATTPMMLAITPSCMLVATAAHCDKNVCRSEYAAALVLAIPRPLRRFCLKTRF